MLCALLELETGFLPGVKDEHHAVELDELCVLESGIGCPTAHDFGDEVPWCDFLEKVSSSSNSVTHSLSTLSMMTLRSPIVTPPRCGIS